MRGSDERTGSLFRFVALEARVPGRHPLRKIRQIVNEALCAFDGDVARLQSCEGRPSIAPKKLVRACLLQASFSVRSERRLMEQLDYNLLFRCFVGLGVDDPVWDATVFTKNRDRLLDAEVAAKVMAAVLAHRQVRPLLSSDHFSVDGTLIEAWASSKNFRAKDGNDEPPSPGRNGERQFRGERRKNDTHESTTDPDARLYRKSNSAAAKLSYTHTVRKEHLGRVTRVCKSVRSYYAPPCSRISAWMPSFFIFSHRFFRLMPRASAVLPICQPCARSALAM